ncbi:uncharacterized protein LOC133909715 [Phragmites australis]|uniref:uncharacterized protein LOC133909715 n=1 Tax=Phragmites australis TaxID=29695 RepID=UPI002D76A506|nr:uncharacterized protein LOC133909715 [Phragmites australis]XP_062208247.1 uncharacterized protein LOC133909715 [Phragmites australis]XP_062208248.1 uncharacterized protein LOC133909715 [Phragmites australis]
MDLLPDDLLANVLRRLPPCSLAASRCVRKDWCAIIDSRRLLRADLLPLRLDAFFCLADLLDSQRYFFGRPSTGRRIGGRLDFLDEDEGDLQWVADHCNGLLLLWKGVVNPATRQWVPLPPYPEPCIGMEGFCQDYFLAYDPIVSPHYEVVCILRVPATEGNIKFKEESEWPSSPYTTHVFSSRKWRWEERSFVREGAAAGTIADMRSDWRARYRHAVYLRGALYVHCQNDFVMRITLWNDKYEMIKSPASSQMADDGVVYLGKSEKGVYSALLWDENRWPQCRVWLLNESCGQMEWVLKSNISLQAVVENFPFDNDEYSRPWIVNYKEDVNEAWAEDEFEWDFDNGIILPETKDNKVGTYNHETVFLGFHPYKEIAFFLVSVTVVSYHLNSSKVQELGILNEQTVVKSFPYTPCWMGELSENN